MSLRHLEHDGNEDFKRGKKKEFPNRDEDKKEKISQEIMMELEDEVNKVKEQEAWMSMNNPALWDGEI